MSTILVIDDKQDNLITATAMLKHFIPDCHVITALSGPDGIEKALTEHPDVILLDIIMPGMDGFEVCRTLKSGERTRSIPVIMLTAIHTDLKSRVKGLELGADAFLSKPIDQAELVAQVKVMLRIKTTEDALRKKGVWLEDSIRERTRELEEEKDRAQKYLDLAGVILLALDTNGTVSLINKKGSKILGYSEEEIIGKNWFDTFVPQRKTDSIRTIFEKVMGGEIQPIEYNEGYVLTKTGEEKLIVWHNTVVTDKQGTITGTLNSGEDITRRRQMEEELQKATKLESLGVLAGGIAHDFNNILMAILGNISLSKLKAADNNQIIPILQTAEKACLRAKELTQQFLTFAKGGTPVIKLSSVVGLVRESMQLAMTGSNVRCKFDFADNLCPVAADESQIHQVLNNLLLNAQQAMPAGGVITIKAENVTDKSVSTLILKPGRYVRVSIEDRGIGISDKHLTRVFDPFFTTKKQGSGLGLSVCYSIIKKHGGYITLDSKLGSGTTVNLFLPVAKVGEVPDRPEKQTIIKGHGKILIMDDEPEVREVVGGLLEYLNYQVEYAADGDEAATKYRRAREDGQAFNAVIMDLTIPGGMGGKEAVRELRIFDPEAKVIVSSGYSTNPVMSNFRQYGFCGVINKPYQLQELSQTLHEVLSA